MAATKIETVWDACCTIVGKEGAPLDEHASLFDLGLDSLGLAELVIQLEELFGEGCITIDDVLIDPVVSTIAAKLGGAAAPQLAGGTVPSTPPAALAHPPKAATAAKSTAPKPTSPKPLASFAPTSTPLSTPLSARTGRSEAATPVVMDRINELENVVSQLTEAVKALTPLVVNQQRLSLANVPTVGETPSLASVLAAAPMPTPVKHSEHTEVIISDVDAAELATARAQLLSAPESDWILTTHVGALPRAKGDTVSTIIQVRARATSHLSPSVHLRSYLLSPSAAFCSHLHSPAFVAHPFSGAKGRRSLRDQRRGVVARELHQRHALARRGRRLRRCQRPSARCRPTHLDVRHADRGGHEGGPQLRLALHPARDGDAQPQPRGQSRRRVHGYPRGVSKPWMRRALSPTCFPRASLACHLLPPCLPTHALCSDWSYV